MYSEIKQLAEEAIKIQNKIKMEEALKRIVELCENSQDTEFLHKQVSIPVNDFPVIAEPIIPGEWRVYSGKDDLIYENPSEEAYKDKSNSDLNVEHDIEDTLPQPDQLSEDKLQEVKDGESPAQENTEQSQSAEEEVKSETTEEAK